MEKHNTLNVKYNSIRLRDKWPVEGDPSEIWYRFGGKQMGYVGNNCTTDVDYQTSIAQRTAAAPSGTPGAFRNGATSGVGYSDFDQSYNPINSYEQGSGAGGYVVRKGDTLQGLAENGDMMLFKSRLIRIMSPYVSEKADRSPPLSRGEYPLLTEGNRRVLD